MSRPRPPKSLDGDDDGRERARTRGRLLLDLLGLEVSALLVRAVEPLERPPVPIADEVAVDQQHMRDAGLVGNAVHLDLALAAVLQAEGQRGRDRVERPREGVDHVGLARVTGVRGNTEARLLGRHGNSTKWLVICADARCLTPHIRTKEPTTKTLFCQENNLNILLILATF